MCATLNCPGPVTRPAVGRSSGYGYGLSSALPARDNDTEPQKQQQQQQTQPRQAITPPASHSHSHSPEPGHGHGFPFELVQWQSVSGQSSNGSRTADGLKCSAPGCWLLAVVRCSSPFIPFAFCVWHLASGNYADAANWPGWNGSASIAGQSAASADVHACPCASYLSHICC